MNVKISQIAEEVGQKSKEILDFAKACGLNVKAVSSGVSEDVAMVIAGVFLGEISRDEAMEKLKNPASHEKKLEPKKSEKPAKKTAEKPIKKVVKRAKKDVDPKPKPEPAPMPEETAKIQQLPENPAPEPESELTEKLISAEILPVIIEKSPEPDQNDENLTPDPKNEAQTNEVLQKAAPKTPFLRRTSIQIVKKNDEKRPEPKKSPQYSIHEIMNEFSAPKTTEKKPKKPKIKAVSHKGNEKKIDFSEREFGARREFDEREFEDENANEIILFDLSGELNDEKSDESKERPERNDRLKMQKKSPWINDGSIVRRRRKKPRFFGTKNEATEKNTAIQIPEEVRVYEFAELANIKLSDVIKALLNLGVMATKNDFLDKDAIELLCTEFEISYEILNSLEIFEDEVLVDDENLIPRAPVVIFMGHVDHGKTTLLDAIRNMNVAKHEAGGITQHMSAYSIEKNGKKISFIDTPGHAAFTQMRGRGAKITDIAVVIIAADDGVKEQTIESLRHAKESGVQILIAMTKIDKDGKNIDKLKSECSDLGFVPSDWGGDYDFIGVSARTGEGIDDLLETILLQAEILNLRANEQTLARAVVLEGAMDRGLGPVASVILQNGVLKIGDAIVADTAFGRVRSILDDTGRAISELRPSDVGVIVGLNEIPTAGAALVAMESDAMARETAQKRAAYIRQKELSKSTKVSFDELNEMVVGEKKILPIIVKTDTHGSLEAIKNSVMELQNDEVKINLISSGVGQITDNDLALAVASKQSLGSSALVFGFGVKPTGVIKARAKELGVAIFVHNVIYALMDELAALVNSLKKPEIYEENLGSAQVKEVYKIKNLGVIAGCFVTDGQILRNARARVLRDGQILNAGAVASLKRFKDDVKEVAKGYECGIMIEGVMDVQIGDVIQSYREQKK